MKERVIIIMLKKILILAIILFICIQNKQTFSQEYNVKEGTTTSNLTITTSHCSYCGNDYKIYNNNCLPHKVKIETDQGIFETCWTSLITALKPLINGSWTSK